MRDALLKALLVPILALGSLATADDNVNDPLRTVVEGNTRFALDLYQQLREGEGNLMLAPYSLSLAMALLYMGARGDSRDEIRDVLHFPAASVPLHPSLAAINARVASKINGSSPFDLDFSNALWMQRGHRIRPDYVEQLSLYYDDYLYELDFIHDPKDARNIINTWVKHHTNEKIRRLLGPRDVDSMTRFIMTSTVYFQASWLKLFDPRQTESATFHLASGVKRDIQMMEQTAYLSYMRSKTFSAVELPYNMAKRIESNLSFLIFLPHDILGLPALEDELTPENLTEWLSEFKTAHIHLSLPKFRFESKNYLSDTLKAMGMPTPFTPKANFSGISPRKGLVLDKVVHQTYISIDEEGTEAAAATGATLGLTSIFTTDPTRAFRADHPFLFAIMDRQTETILFLGRFETP